MQKQFFLTAQVLNAWCLSCKIIIADLTTDSCSNFSLVQTDDILNKELVTFEALRARSFFFCMVLWTRQILVDCSYAGTRVWQFGMHDFADFVLDWRWVPGVVWMFSVSLSWLVFLRSDSLLTLLLETNACRPQCCWIWLNPPWWRWKIHEAKLELVGLPAIHCCRF